MKKMRSIKMSFLILAMVELSSCRPRQNSSKVNISTAARNCAGQDALDCAKEVIAKSDTIEAVIAGLDPGFKREAVLVYRSSSIQPSSPNFPRVILSGATGHFILAYTGDPSNSVYNTLEAMNFNESTRSWDFFEWRFGKNGAISDEFKRSSEKFNDHEVYLEKNPKICQSCHLGQPIWEDYGLWPGVYGSAEGAMLMREKSRFDSFYKEQVISGNKRYEPISVYPSAYVPALQIHRFAENLTTSLYRHTHKQVSKRISDHLKENGLESFRYLIAASMLACKDHKVEEYIPSSLLNRGELPYEDLYRLIEKNQAYVDVQKVRAIFHDIDYKVSDDLDALFNRSAHGEDVSSQIRAILAPVFSPDSPRMSFSHLRGSYMRSPKPIYPSKRADTFNSMTWTLQFVGLDTKGWGLRFGRDEYFFRDPIFNGGLARTFIRDHKIYDEVGIHDDLQEEQSNEGYLSYDAETESKACDKLVDLSRNSLKAYNGNNPVHPPSSLAARSEPPTNNPTQVCAGCHDRQDQVENNVPKILFRDLAKLREKISSDPDLLSKIILRMTTNDASLRMPPGQPLNEKQRIEILRALQ